MNEATRKYQKNNIKLYERVWICCKKTTTISTLTGHGSIRILFAHGVFSVENFILNGIILKESKFLIEGNFCVYIVNSQFKMNWG